MNFDPAEDDSEHLRLVHDAQNVHAIDAELPELLPADHFLPEVLDLWNEGLPGGYKTGWPSLDKHYTVAPGQLTVLTGWPGSGKSEWLDHLLVNLAAQNWKFAIYSAENQPVQLHIAKLMEKLASQPFGEGPNQRIPYEHLPDYIQELAHNFHFISPKLNAVPLHKIIATASQFLLAQDGKKAGMVIDPWNELEHARPRHKSETEYISESLSYLRNWARSNGVHVWLVAHPAKQPREEGKLPVPTPDMISGSQHWWNKADCALTVWRDQNDLVSRETHVFIQKIRFKNIGITGEVPFNYDRVTGRYSEKK